MPIINFPIPCVRHVIQEEIRGVIKTSAWSQYDEKGDVNSVESFKCE